MNKTNVKNTAVGYQEALDAAKTLRWRMDYLEENGVKGAAFLAEVEDELNQAEALLNRKFTAKAAELKDLLASRVNQVQEIVFNSAEFQASTIH